MSPRSSFSRFGLSSLSPGQYRSTATAGVFWAPPGSRFAAQTSIVPIAAIAAGRNRLSPGEVGAWRFGIAAVVHALMLVGHAYVIGVSPF
jgi:uncharacterized membrane protein